MITILLRHLDRERFRPSLALFSREGAFLEEIPGDVPIFDLGERSPYNVFRTAARLSRVIRSARPSVILGVLNHPNLVTLAVCRAFFRDIPVVISARNNLSLSLKKDRGRHLKRFLHRCFYPRARRVIAVSCGVKDDLERRFGIPGDQIQVIYNPCEIDRIQRLAREQPGLPIDWSIPTVVAVGRLTEQIKRGYRFIFIRMVSLALLSSPSSRA